MSVFSKSSPPILRRTASEIKKYRVLTKIFASFAALGAIVVAGVYIVSILYSKYGSFTVKVQKYDSLNYGITLSETPDFISKTTRLNSRASEEVTNISVKDLPLDLDNINGEHNGKNYVAYTFYMKNVGKFACDCEYQLYIVNMTRDIERAVRVRLYKNGEATDFARTRTDGGGAELGTTEFYNETVITKDIIKSVEPEQITKFTVVIWLEGDDPDCIDNIIGGQFKIDMSIRIADADFEDK